MPTAPLRRLLRVLPLAALGAALISSGASAEAPETPAVESPLLWQVDGGAQPSYLFGTIHAGVAAEELPSSVDQALQASPLFIMETRPQGGLSAPFTRAPVPMDIELARRAAQSGKTIATLESLRFQLSLMAQLGNAEDFAALLADDAGAIAPLIAAYRRGDIDALAAMSASEDPTVQDILLHQRNRDWSAKLGNLLPRGGAFIAVGAAHMSGRQGLLELFQERGYNARRIS